MDVKLGKVAKALHYAYWATEIVFKTGAFYAASGSNYSTAAFFMFTLGHSIPYLTAHTVLDVKVRQMIKSSWMTRKLGGLRGIERAIVLSSGAVKFEGMMITERKSQNYVFIETSEPLPELTAEQVAMFGAPLNISDSRNTRISFRLVVDGNPNAMHWEAPLIDILDGKPIPHEVAEGWREELRVFDEKSKKWSEDARRKAPWLADKVPSLDYLMHKHDLAVRVDATLTLPSGEAVPIDSVIVDGQVRKLLGMKLSQRAKDFFSRKVLGGELVERSLSLDMKRFPLSYCERKLTAP